MAIVNEEGRARFVADGYLIVRGLLDPERDLAPLRLEYESLLDAVAHRLHGAVPIVVYPIRTSGIGIFRITIGRTGRG